MGVLFSLGLQNRYPLVYFHPKPTYLAVRKSRTSGEIERTSLRNLVESRCKSLFTEFTPVWWLFNGHLQTIYCVLGDFSKTDKLIYDRKYIRLLDGGTIGLDFAPVDSPELPDDVPIVVVMHGLTGGSYEAYVRAVLAPACTPVAQGGLGYRAVVVNFRGCAGVPITSPQLYSAGHTDDLRQSLMYISKIYPRAPLLGLGFSLGANVMIRYIAEEGEQCRLVSGCALACPWDLAKNNFKLTSTFIGKHIYAKGMGGNLLNLVKRHVNSLLQDPEHRVAKAIPAVLSLSNPTLEQFDETFTRIAGGAAPTFPFATAMDYYLWASSHKAIKDIKVPFLAINAADDPVVRDAPMDGASNGSVVMVLTQGGGHLGWFEAGKSCGEMTRWYTRPVLEWLQLAGEDIVHDGKIRSPPLYTDENGFLKENEKAELGFKEIEGGCTVDGSEGESGMFQGL